MSNFRFDQAVEEKLARDREIVLDQLTKIFDPEIAEDYVCPKTHETRQQVSIEELRHLKFDEWDPFIKRLRSLVHYQTTTQSLNRVDLEGSYQAFVRNEVAQNSPRRELERFVRNSSDIDTAKRYLNVANDTLINPQQSLLLFRSSKLNEQKANLLKSSGCVNDLQKINDDPKIEKYFSTTLKKEEPVDSNEETEDKFFRDQRSSSATRSIHLQHDEKKYRVEFLKGKSNSAHPSSNPTTDRPRRIKEKLAPDTIESLLTNTDSMNRDQSKAPRMSALHRETFPPLSMSALKEYRPTLTPNWFRSRRSSSTTKDRFRHQATSNADFIWQASLV